MSKGENNNNKVLLSNKTTGKGLRYNEGKLRLDLLPPFATQKVAKVFTDGAKKYAPHNWEKGMNWSSVLASLKRHILAFESGEDFDEESGNYHMAHVATNALFLLEYYKIYPHGDDRQHWYLRHGKIGLDIDDVLADFIPHYQQYFNQTFNVESWNFDPEIKKRLQELKDKKDFWLSMPTKTKPQDIPFEPFCYITSRVCPTEITEQWLHNNGFPNAPVFSVGLNGNKAKIAKEQGIDIFVDDRFENFKEMTEAGICCYLYDAPHNQRYSVGHKRIKGLDELPFFSKN